MHRTFFVALALLAGCSGGPHQTAAPAPSAPPAPSQRSTGEFVVDGITGRGAVRAGKQAQATIEAVSKQKNKDLKEAMGE
jgi:hypothetical protein